MEVSKISYPTQILMMNAYRYCYKFMVSIELQAFQGQYLVHEVNRVPSCSDSAAGTFLQ